MWQTEALLTGRRPLRAATAAASRGRWALALAGLVLASAGARVVLARGVATPWIAPDEMIYSLLGRALYQSGRLAILGGPTPFYSLVYPGLVGLPLAGRVPVAGLQALVMSLTAVPVYVWGRGMMRSRAAFLAAVLTVAIPALAYSALMMSEVVFYPVVVVCAWAAARALERPTLRRQAILAVALGLAVATRLQALALLPALAGAAVLHAWLRRDLRRLRAFWPWAAALGFVLAAAALRSLTGVGLKAMLGGYRAIASGGYGFGSAFHYVVYHAGDVVLLCGVAPAAAFGFLLVPTLRRREATAAVEAFVCISFVWIVFMVVEVGVFASRYGRRLEERDLVGVAPLLFLAFALWLDRGAPRPSSRVTAIVCALAFELVAVLPLGGLVAADQPQDTLSLAPLYLFRPPHVQLAASLLTAVVLACVVRWPRRAMPALAVALVAGLLAASVAAAVEVRAQSRASRSELGVRPGWIDELARGKVGILYDGEVPWTLVWADVFWNRKVAAVYDVPGSMVPGPLPQRTIGFLPDGRLELPSGHRPAAIVAPLRFAFVGTRLGSFRPGSAGAPVLVVWRLRTPPRLAAVTTGLTPHGTLVRRARLLAYGCRSGRFHVALRGGHRPATVTLRAGGGSTRRVAVAAGQSWSGWLPARPASSSGGGTCVLQLTTSGVVRVALAAPGAPADAQGAAAVRR